MIDAFVLLTPILLLLIIALLGFVGCSFQPHQVDPSVAHVQTTVASGAMGTDTITADLPNLEGGELIIATLQWGSPAVNPPTPLLTGANFASVNQGGPFQWAAMRIQAFFGSNPNNSQSVTVKAILPTVSTVPWNLCVSAYRNTADGNPIVNAQTNGTTFIGTDLQAPAISIEARDLVYAVAFAADNNGAFPGNSLTAGAGFTARSDTTNPLVEDGGTPGATSAMVTAQATNTTTNPNPRGFIFAAAIKAVPPA